MKTFNDLLDYLERYEGKEVRDKCEANAKALRHAGPDNMNLLSTIMFIAFTWRDTPQLFDYWLAIHHRILQHEAKEQADGTV